MAADQLGHFEPGSAEWHAAREGGLGGSEIAAVLGLSPFESRFSLWHRKAGLLAPVQETPEMEWGKRLEPVIAAKFAECHPEFAVERTGLWRNSERPYQLGQPDRDCGGEDPGPDGPLLEIKQARWGEYWGEPGTDDIPVGYKAQTRWYMDCLGRRRCYVAVLIAPCDYREYMVEWDEQDALLMRQEAEEFLATVTRNERPPIDDSEATHLAIRELHPEIDPRDHRVPDDLAVAYLTALADHEAATAEKRRQVSLVLDAMGTARRAMWGQECIATRVPGKNGGTPYLRAVNFASQRLDKSA